ncbi:hypothetical protein PRIPAC_88063 [Pristionchus pacificus]|uniref:Uncharacterized protein n=1 Tax=Pristionchus pacificus TaxID=54126 RepID=A0A2A6B8V2_PRIPA|nr:hypothetical protein PRIPAC_88063 [Pristionchus pacificus]|eukprot:PDM62306.1 hypothetical protein PRIPAC_51748 [Pristionchus pacificus]
MDRSATRVKSVNTFCAIAITSAKPMKNSVVDRAPSCMKQNPWRKWSNCQRSLNIITHQPLLFMRSLQSRGNVAAALLMPAFCDSVQGRDGLHMVTATVLSQSIHLLARPLDINTLEEVDVCEDVAVEIRRGLDRSRNDEGRKDYEQWKEA